MATIGTNVSAQDSSATPNLPAAGEKFQDAAQELFQLAAMLLGDESAAVELVEHTMATTEVNPCSQPAEARAQVLSSLLDKALSRLKHSAPQSFDPQPASAGAPVTCIEEDDLSAAGLNDGQLADFVSGNGRARLRAWLQQLSALQRTVFVQRAVLGQDNQHVAETLSRAAAGWSPQMVANVFRQALCSLATSLVHASNPA